MNSNRHERISELFLIASEMPPEEQVAYVQRECAGDGELAEEILDLLGRNQEPSAALDHGVFHLGEGHGAWEAFLGETTPERLGAYEILDTLGEGGMGTVFLARQENPSRDVALKVIRRDLGDTTAQQRFQLEAESLGRLAHPGIAQIFEAGISDGIPFFAMERVEGETLDRWAKNNDPTDEELLELLVRVAQAVGHAHLNGVVHRDLKPSNILVDATGQPKILDFGIARLADDKDAKTHLTQAGQLVGTLPYMSPEQAVGNPDKVDGRTDVYSLGVVAFELMAGRLPIEVGNQPLSKALQRIAEEDPPLLGTFDRRWRGDVETIVARALEKEPARRYSSMRDFSDDLERYLAHEPIRARPQSTIYQITKLARRHRPLFLGSAVALMALVGGLVATVLQQRKTEVALEESDAVVEFLGDVLASLGPDQLGREAYVSDALSVAGERMLDSSKGPVVKARLQSMLGRSWMTLGKYEQAIPVLEEATAQLAEELHPADQRLHQAQMNLGKAYLSQGEIPEAKRVTKALTERTSKEFGPGHHQAQEANLLRVQVMRYAGETKEALALLERIKPLSKTIPDKDLSPQDHLALLEYQETKGMVLHSDGRFKEAIAQMRDTIEHAESIFGKDHWRILPWRNALAAMLKRDFQLEESLALVQSNVDILRSIHGSEHPLTLMGEMHLGETLLEAARFDEAGPLVLTVAEQTEKLYGAHHPTTLRAIQALVTWHSRTWDWSGAQAIAEDRCNRAEAVFGPTHASTIAAKVDLGEILFQLEDYSAATDLLYPLVQVDQPLEREHPDRLVGAATLAMCLVRLRQADAAEAFVDLDSALKVFGPKHPVAMHSRNALAQIKGLRGDLKGAEKELRSLCQEVEESAGRDSDAAITGLLGLGQNLVAQRRASEAMEIFEDLTERVKRTRPPMGPLELALIQERSQLYTSTRQPELAIELLQPYFDAIDEAFEKRESRSISIISSYARALVKKGDLLEGTALYERLQKVTEYHFDELAPASVIGLYQLAQLYGLDDRHQIALERMQEAMRRFEKSDLAADPMWRTRFLLNIGRLHNKLGEHQTALGILEEAQKGAEQAGIPAEISYVKSVIEELAIARAGGADLPQKVENPQGKENATQGDATGDKDD